MMALSVSAHTKTSLLEMIVVGFFVYGFLLFLWETIFHTALILFLFISSVSYQ